MRKDGQDRTSHSLQGIPPSQILAMTFTNKAAVELQERLAAKGVEGVNAMTNHSFCMKVLRRNHKKAGFKQMPLVWSAEAELRAVFSEAMRSPLSPMP